MKIVVLNGSPKGSTSVTMQYINYIQKKFNNHELKIINISQRINQIENDTNVFSDIINEIKCSDGVIWAFPLYFYLVPSQYKKFIELIFEKNSTSAFNGKYTAILTTSIHFFDHTAINYMNSICDDLNMKYVDYFSLEMYDLEKAPIRKNLLKFIENFFDTIQYKKNTFKNYDKLIYSPIEYTPEIIYDQINVYNKKIVIITDSLENKNLKTMIEKFRSLFSQNVELINLQDIDIKGGCLGCMKCAYNYECSYTNKDDFIDFYNDKIKTADILVFAGSIKDRYLSATWKKYFDRSFFNTHTPSLSDKQIGFLISGPLNQIPNLKQILDAYIQWQKANLIGFVSDEYESSKKLDESLYNLANKLINSSINDYKKPSTFLGVGGWKIFRDEMWGNLRFPFIADHKAYKKLNVYDFPQKNYKSRIVNSILILLTKIPVVRKDIYSNTIKTDMLKPLKKVLEDPNS